MELAEQLCDDGPVLVRPRGEGTIEERLATGLVDADLRPDPVSSTALRPFVALLGDLEPPDLQTVQAIGLTLSGTVGLLIARTAETTGSGAYVELGPVDETASTSIALDAAPHINELVLGRVLRAAAGRPGVIVPLARANRRTRPDDALKVPDTVGAELEARLGALSFDAGEVMQWAAVLGSPFDPALLVRLMGRTPDGLAPTLDNLIAEGLVAEIGTPSTPQLEIPDALVIDVIRQAVPPSERRRRNLALLNARRARGDEPADLVQHAIGSAQPAEVIALSLRAANLARTRHDFAQAVEHAERAIDWVGRGTDPAYLDAMLEKGLAMAGLGRWPDATQILHDVVRRQRRIGNEPAAMRAVTEWARMRWHAGYRREAFDVLTSNIPDGDEPNAERVTALTHAANFASIAGQLTQALAWGERGRDEALAIGDPLAAAAALSTYGVARVRATASPDVFSDLRKATAEAQALGHHRQTAIAINNESFAMLVVGCPQQAADRAQHGLDLIEAKGLAELDAPLCNNLAEALVALGRLREARRVAGRSRAAYEALGARSLMDIDGLLAWIDFAEGKVPEALSTIRSVALENDDEVMIEDMGPLAAWHVHIAHAAGELDEAREVASTALDYWHQTENVADSITLLGAACEVLPAAEAKRVKAELGVPAAAGSPLAHALLAYADGWSAKAASSAVTAFSEAADRFSHGGFAWWAARCRMLAGERVPKSGGVDDLLEARRIFRDLEAPGWRSRCEAELRARGHKFVMASRHREDAELTAREIEVLRHVAIGLTNREIADRLFISEKTAGRHLERIFDKLGLTTRAAAVNAGVELGLVTEVADQLIAEVNSGGSGALSGVESA